MIPQKCLQTSVGFHELLMINTRLILRRKHKYFETLEQNQKNQLIKFSFITSVTCAQIFPLEI